MPPGEEVPALRRDSARVSSYSFAAPGEEKERCTRNGGNASAIGPLDLPGHEASREHIDSLQNPDGSEND